MISGFKSIRSVADVFDGPHATPTKTDSGPYFLSISSLEKGRLDLSKSAHLSEEQFKTWTRRVTPEAGDVLFSYETRLGEAALMPKGIRACLGRRMGLLRPRRHKVIPEYLLYAFLSPIFQEEIKKRTVHGATVDRIALQELPDFPIRIPEIKEQEAVIGILKTLDQKIALNRELNETLEGMARALFQSWFVDFDPVKAKLAAKRHGRDPEHACMAALSGKLRIPPGKPSAERLDDQLPTAGELDAAIAALDTLIEAQRQQLTQTASYFPEDFQDSELGLIPVAWEVKPFSEIFEINPRRILKKNAVAPYLDMKSVPTSGPSPEGIIRREFKSGTKFINGDTLLARITPCLENGKTAFVDFLKDDEVGWGSTEFIIIRPKNINPAIGYFYARSDELRAHAITNMSGTSGRQRVPADCFDNFLIPSPDNSFLYEAFGQTAQAALNSVRSNSNQSRTLAELRDSLLPKLLSGELSPSAAEDTVEAAAAS